MTTYLLLFLNIIFFSLLKFFDVNLFIEKLNFLTLFNIILIYSLAIYKKETGGKSFHIPTYSVFLLFTLIIYNSVIINKPMLVITALLFVLFFILDYKYNSIKIDPYKEKKAKVKPEFSHESENTSYSNAYNTDEKENDYKKEEQKRAFEDDIRENMINMELEEYLVLLGLSHDYTRKQLKVAYKMLAHENHPDKFPVKEKDFQTGIMKEINNAKSYLEDLLKRK